MFGTREVSIVAAALVGLAAGVGVYTFAYARGASYMTDDPRACANCHVMEEQYAGWSRSSHRSVAVCNDCHTPWRMTPEGPAPDMTRMLSGHPQDLAMPPAPALPAGPWVGVMSGSMTAWSGPWGVSFTANLTPDAETGLGNWTEQDFVDTMRSGRHQGRGRQLLPPMPWQSLNGLTDQDLKAVFAYLKSIPAIQNRVPDPIAPAAAR